MCNRYRASDVVRIRDTFGFTYIESGPPIEGRSVGPLQSVPFLRPGHVLMGQWGLIPDGSKTRKPTRADGKPMSTNNARFGDGKPEKWSFRGPWERNQRCLIPAETFDEPYWPDGAKKCTWWRFARADGAPFAIAGLWNDWTDPASGEITPSLTMLTINCDGHPLLGLMHKPDPNMPADRQDKRTIVPIERNDWDVWLHGSPRDAAALMRVAPLELFKHGPADSSVEMALPL